MPRLVVGLTVGVVVLLAAPAGARADPAEPTDYRSEVVSMHPAVDGVDVSVVGGDAFLQLRVAPGRDVMVLGYQAEPFIRVLADGRVEENRRSPSWALSQDRFPSGPLPDDVGAGLEPRWVEVGTDGTWVWHDHRVHWMGAEPPMGLGPGDQVVDGVVPILVDGTGVEVRVVSIWQRPPSPWPASIGAVLGVAAAALCLVRRRAAPVVGTAAAAAALVIGGWQHLSLPAATGPRLTSWLLPAVALLAAGSATIAGRRRQRARVVEAGALLIAGAELALWAAQRRAGLVRAVLPTEAPAWLDRAVTAFVVVVAIGLVALAVVQLASFGRSPTSAERLDVVDDAIDLGVGQGVRRHDEGVPRDTLG